MPAATEPIEATFTELPPDAPAPAPAVDPLPCPGTDPLSRADVLRFAHTLHAQVVGLGAAVEGAALTAGRVRPEFTRAWRTWSGAFMADVARLERSLFVAQDEARLCAGYAGRLAEWRRAIAAEMGAAQASAPAAAKQPDPISKHSWRRWPWFVIVPGSVGAVFGTYFGVRWMFRQLLESVQSAGDREQSGEG